MAEQTKSLADYMSEAWPIVDSWLDQVIGGENTIPYEQQRELVENIARALQAASPQTRQTSPLERIADALEVLAGKQDQQEVYPLRTLCTSCGGTEGTVREKNGQACVYCWNCGKFQYNAPKSELERFQRAHARFRESKQ